MTPEPNSTPESLEQTKMSLLEHLAELRVRLIYALAAVLIGTVICWTWADELFRFLLMPLHTAAPNAELAQIHHKDLAEPFFALLKTAIMGGIFISLPVILYQVWAFVAPGLYDRERKMAIPFVFFATLCFVGGAAFCFFLVLPAGYGFLLEFGASISEAQLMVQEYYALTIKLLLVFGLTFELPVVAVFLSALGVIDHRTLARYWRVAVVGAFVAGAFLTPADPMTQCLLAVPLVLLYGVSIGMAWVVSR
jgi:sec-independent protein translocase protein TatC